MWEKVVLNLLSNAFKFTLEGGITVRVAATARGAELRVSDTGSGIPKCELPRLFERFYRIEGQQGRSFEGSGIGLALVQEMVRLHGGSIAAESEVGRGTTFSVVLPFGFAHLPAGTDRRSARAVALLRHAPRSTWRRPCAGCQMMVRRTRSLATMNENSARAHRSSAPTSCWRTTTPTCGTISPVCWRDAGRSRRWRTGVAALAAARRRRPDLVLSDVMMPRLDGFGLVAALRQDPGLAEIPVILLSARAGEEAQVEGLGAGADDYLIKPFAARELLARVAANIALSRLRRETGDRVRKSEARLQAAVELVGLSPFAWDPADGRARMGHAD